MENLNNKIGKFANKTNTIIAKLVYDFIVNLLSILADDTFSPGLIKSAL